MDQFIEVSAWVARGLLGLVFLLAGLSKARAPASFERSLAQYGLLPAGLRPLVAGSLPALEVLLGTLLVLGVLAPVSSVIALALLVAFTGASFLTSKDQASDCGCFGSFGTLNVKNVVARNAVLSGLALVALVSGTPAYTLVGAVGVLPGLALAAGLAVAALLVARAKTSAPVASAQPQTLAFDPGRRSFLGKLAVLGAGSVAATLMTLRGAPKAEAACYGCPSCGYAYYWIACTGLCCAAFWQVPMDYCPPYCYACGGWNVVTFCGYPQCC
ncbi:MAG TPA: MauE/DoxX family redox-associated membrane protein [Dehalococcoidia bacterium]|nr:MauE/DoxX family redox-associated membrane protein [Dehalococcoidia bacterium]